MTTPENQNQFIVPTNEITQTIDYNTRFLISDNQINPIAWEVSKREDMFPTGVTWITIKQTLFNPNWDNKELMIADYYKRNNKESADQESSEYTITYSGDPYIKAGGSFKTYTLSSKEECTWEIIGLDKSKYETNIANFNSISIKILSDYSLIGTIFKLEAIVEGKEVASVNIEVISL